jgi:hypothetical protein
MALGQPCCASHDEAVSKIAAPMLNMFVHMAWDTSAISRWTFVLTTLRRFLLGCVCYRILPTALHGVTAHWQLSEDMVADLEKKAAAEDDDFHSKAKLRLLSVAKTLAPPDAAHQIAILVTSIKEVDAVMYAILGHKEQDRPRATLRELLDERTSVLAGCQQGLLRLLEGWGPTTPEWELLSETGCDFQAEATAMWARGHILRLAAGCFDNFDARYSAPPYTLAKLVDPGVPVPARRQIAQRFLQVPEHCLPLFGKRLRARCPTVHALMDEGAAIIDAWLRSTVVGIDYVERSHASMRVDIRASGKGRSSTASANKVLLQQMRAEFEKKSGARVHNASQPKRVGPPRPGGWRVGAEGRRRRRASARCGWQPADGVHEFQNVCVEANPCPKSGHARRRAASGPAAS